MELFFNWKLIGAVGWRFWSEVSRWNFTVLHCVWLVC